MKYTNKHLIAVLVACGTVCFLFFNLAYPYHLLHREQMLLFTYTKSQLADYFNHPAFLSCLAGDFLTQFFHSVVPGAAVVALTMMTVSWLAYLTCRRWLNGWVSLLLSMGIFLWECLRFCEISYPLSGTLSLIGALALFLGVCRLKEKWPFAIGSVCGSVLCYFLFGYGLFVFALLTTTYALTRERKNNRAVCATVIITLALPNIAAQNYLMMPLQACAYPATCGWGGPNFEDERILGLNTEDYFEDWNQITELVRRGRPGNAVSVCYNLANAMQGKLPDRLMDYYQPAALGLFMPVNEKSTYLSTQLAGEVWFRLGDMTMAEHAAILSMIFSPNGKSVRMVQRLAEINLVNGDEEAAKKYLRMLSNTLFYKQWAKDRTPGKESEEVKAWLERKHACLPQTDTLRLSSTDVARSLHLLLEANPSNRMARDYLLCFDLLMKDLPTFRKDYAKYHTGTPERLYAEALMILFYQQHATGAEIKTAGIHPNVVKQFNEYNQRHKQWQGEPSALENRFGQTYWFYYQFARFQ